LPNFVVDRRAVAAVVDRQVVVVVDIVVEATFAFVDRSVESSWQLRKLKSLELCLIVDRRRMMMVRLISMLSL